MTFSPDKYKWPLSNAKLACLFGVKEGTIRVHQNNHLGELIKGEDYWGADLGVANSPTLMTVWSKQGAIKMARHCRRSTKAFAFLKEMGVRDIHEIYPEGKLLDIIESAVKGYSECFRPYAVNSYRVDLYLKDLKIVIECDERGHKYKQTWDENARQEEIEQTLGCKFIRFNPDDPGFNIGQVVNTLIKEIIAKRKLCT